MPPVTGAKIKWMNKGLGLGTPIQTHGNFLLFG